MRTTTDKNLGCTKPDMQLSVSGQMRSRNRWCMGINTASTGIHSLWFIGWYLLECWEKIREDKIAIWERTHVLYFIIEGEGAKTHRRHWTLQKFACFPMVLSKLVRKHQELSLGCLRTPKNTRDKHVHVACCHEISSLSYTVLCSCHWAVLQETARALWAGRVSSRHGTTIVVGPDVRMCVLQGVFQAKEGHMCSSPSKKCPDTAAGT